MIDLGEKLKEARLEKGLDLKDVAKNTKIREDYLMLIENGDYSKLPSITHAQGFVRNYVRFLGLDVDSSMALFRRVYDEKKAYSVLPKGFEAKDEFPISRFKIKRTAIVIVLILFLLLAYIFYQYRYAFINPPLTVTSPLSGSTINSSEVKVSGKTDYNSTVYIDQNAVSVDSSGNFQEIINVFPGKTIVDVKVVNKFQRVTDKKIEFDVKGS